MALITCPECGKQISDKADVCIGCGYPIAKYSDHVGENTNDFDVIADRIYVQYAPQYTEAIKQLRITTGCDLKTARDAIQLRKGRKDLVLQNDIRKKSKEQFKQSIKEIPSGLKGVWNEFESSYDSVVRCPKCKSTSISYDTKKFSFGRALVGDAVAGAPGAIIGGLSSKKGYAVCLNCGKRWKV